jgi:TrpR family transcriptional regulator, trp operon repressor
MSFTQNKKELIQTFLTIKNETALDRFLIDLLTPQELQEIVNRWQLVKQLHRGVPQRQIAHNLGISIAKITRGSRMLLNRNGGFNLILNKNKKKK